METNKIIVVIVVIVLSVLIFFLVRYNNKKSSKIQNINKENERKQEEENEKFKKDNPEEYEKMNIKRKEKLLFKNKIWKKGRKGLIIFAFIHFIFEIVSESDQTYILMVAVNYQISKYFIRKQIDNKNPNLTKNPIAFSIGISLIVFCFRLLLGFLWTFYKTI
jgi:Ca2+/Na+ antiporter